MLGLKAAFQFFLVSFTVHRNLAFAPPNSLAKNSRSLHSCSSSSKAVICRSREEAACTGTAKSNGLGQRCRNLFTRSKDERKVRLQNFSSSLVHHSEGVGRRSNLELLQAWLTSDDTKRLGVWAAFIALACQLRSFYSVILGTFVLSYIGNTVVNWSMKHVNNLLARSSLPFKKLPRKLYALVYTCMLLSLITTTTVLTVPRINVEGQFLASLGEQENPYTVIADWARANFGPEALNKLEPFLLSVTGESGRIFAGYNVDYRELIAAKLTTNAPWSQERSAKFAKLLQFCLSKYIKSALGICSTVVTQLTATLYKSVLSLLFSLMVIWDLPGLSKGIDSLKASKLSFAYRTVAPEIQKFAKLVGQSFEVQFLIAVSNTILTTFGLIGMGISGAWVLGSITFVCSFIPVAGVFISTLPMAVAALGEYGVSKVFAVILMVIAVHIAEAYVLNPQIYSSKLHMPPIFILTVLYMAEHLVGIQALLIAVPVAVYLMNTIVGESSVEGGPIEPAEQKTLPP